jgi:gliding motility-associated-like protein
MIPHSPKNLLIIGNRKLYIIIFIFLLINTSNLAQTITVNDARNTPEELVDLLIGNSCISRSNVKTSSNKSVAYFNNNSGIFPISEGIILRNGIAEYTSGPYNNVNLSSQISTDGDIDLQNISNSTGQGGTITDVAFLEFDFIPLANTLNFNFLFASNEYGEYQCSFSDVFAIILTNINTGESVNLAVLPNTDTNISVKNIRDNIYNSSCTSINENFFKTYNVDNPSSSSLNMRGHTTVLNASASVIIDSPYRIKFAIGDYNDGTFDSAVFIESGSFEASFSLGEDKEICDGNEITLDSNYTNTIDYSFEWQKDGTTIIGATNPFFTTTEAGVYKLIITNLISNCVLEDQITISNIVVNQPNNIIECATGNAIPFNLTLNNQDTLGIDESIYDVVYYNSIFNANNNISINTNQIENYFSNGNETIYIKLLNKNNNSFCNEIYSFELTIVDFGVTIPNNILVCESETLVNIPLEVESEILTGLNPLNYTVKYYSTSTDANNNENEITDSANFILPTNNTNPINIWVRIISNIKRDCFEVIDFFINISPLPLVDDLPNQYGCFNYTLPTLTNGNYFTESGGNGVQLFPGDIITDQMRVYIYNVNSNGCINETTFFIFIADKYNLREEYCGQFTVPFYLNANFYTAPLGPDGGGTIIPRGTILTESQSIYFYVENDDESFCLEKEFPIIIYKLPIVDAIDDIITCNSYTLPAITNGNYYTDTDGDGIQLNAGDEITSNSTVYIYNKDNITNCDDESFFNITIINTNVFQDLNACGSYNIPNLSSGSYFTESNGNGTIINSGTTLTSSQTIYFYAPEITTTPNCTNNISINITIKPIPLVDQLEDVLRCEDNLLSLPALVNGNYFTQPNGSGMQLFEGDTINSTQTIYIYNENTFCNAETSFFIEIRPKPVVDNFTDIFSCEAYVLPSLNNGQYFTESNGQGSQLNAGDIINESQFIYIFNKDNNIETCTNENIFEVNIFTIVVDKPENKIACESYILPSLSVGNYYTEANGQGTQLSAGTIINTSQTIYIYAELGDRFLCTDEHEFTISVFNKPIITAFEDIQICNSFTLPILTIPNVTLEYYRNPDRVDIIDPSEYTILEIGTKTIYVIAYPIGNPDCYIEDEFQITIYPLLDLKVTDGIICVDYNTGLVENPYLLETNLDENDFLINWYLDGNLVGSGANYNAEKAGNYTIETIKLTTDVGENCNYNLTEVKVKNSSPKFEIVFVSDYFVDNYTIDVNTINEGLGNYVYSLDNGSFQDSNRFQNISPGEYTITVKDLLGYCKDVNIEFVALKYPKFFTPNNDGKNETWNITDLKNNINAIIKIYTRYGRLVAVIKPNSKGWDGFNNNGNAEPSNDYWFMVEYTKNGKIVSYRNHFSLLRK